MIEHAFASLKFAFDLIQLETPSDFPKKRRRADSHIATVFLHAQRGRIPADMVSFRAQERRRIPILNAFRGGRLNACHVR